MLIGRRSLVLLLLLGTLPGAAAADPIEPPCAGCGVAIPEREGPIPLLIVLHGDHEQATKRLERWSGPALARGWGVLALQCPEKLGCRQGVWYRWNGDPKWVRRQLNRLARTHEIDRERVFLVGWSGGATYAGMHAQVWQRTFAALVMHGGGAGPSTGRCASRQVPVYFLVGDGNRYHSSAKLLRTHFERCGAHVRWDLQEGVDHDAEDAALDDVKANEILDWLAERTDG